MLSPPDDGRAVQGVAAGTVLANAALMALAEIPDDD
jgi:hypothetical protein